MINGGCLCGGVRFVIERALGPFELCHCSQCRKASGSAFVAGLGVRRADFQLLAGRDLIQRFEAPVREAPPGYTTFFCGRCGSPTPDPDSTGPWMEIPAGLLDEDPGLRPDKHIFIDHKAAWYTIHDPLPQMDKDALIRWRQRNPN